MKCGLMGAAMALALVLAGCGNQPSGTLEITENGTHDVSNYAQVVVSIAEEERGEALPESVIPGSLNLARVQFRGFSMEVPAELVEGYTEAELTENDTLTFTNPDLYSGEYVSVGFSRMELHGLEASVDQYSDAPQEEVSGVMMAVKHGHSGDLRDVEVQFIAHDALYRVTLYYSVALDSLFADYSEQFYRSIQID